MTSCTIIISHYESLPFLRASIRQIKKYSHPEIKQKIIVLDQSHNVDSVNVFSEFSSDYDVIIINVEPYYSGYGIDWAMRYLDIKTDYILQLHADAFPVHKNWIYLPVKLIEEYNFSFVGQLHFISKPTDTIYPPGNPFFSMSPTFNVAKTETYKEMSLEAGFTRFHNRPQSGLQFKNNDWNEWASADYHARGSDDDVVAFHWYGKYKTDNMLGLAITGFIESSYGRLIDDLVFHFGSCREATTVMDKMPERYRVFTERINNGYDDALIDEMVELSKSNRPPELEILTRNLWDGKLKECIPIPGELNKRIEELKIM